jgi:hypothetical protein
MSERRGSARSLAIGLMTAIATLSIAPAAFAAASPADVCAAFPHRQTYVGELGFLRAPAWHYGKTVSVVYETSSCDAHVTDSGRYVLTVRGTASIYDGPTTTGQPFDKRAFRSDLRADTENGSIGWPIDWWSCFEGSFSYVWTIDDVYVFSVAAEDGRWAMAQRDPASGDADGRVFDACKK